jgi:hypothetical protein
MRPLPIGKISSNFIHLQPHERVNRQHFLKVLQAPNSMAPTDLQELEVLVREYPYSQLLHTLMAKGTHDAQSPEAPHRLSRAAMYIADRAVLREIMESTRQGRTPLPITPDSNSAVENTPPPKPSKPLPSYNDLQPIGHEDAEILRREVMQNLEQLVRLKHAYEVEELREEASKPKNSKREVAVTSSVKKPRATPSKKEVEKINEKALQPKPRKKPIKKVVTKAAEVLKKPGRTVKAKTSTTTAPTVVTEDTLIASVAQKQEKIPAKTNQKQQLKIIEKFIKEQPSLKISKPGAQEEKEVKDLSQSSTDFGEDLISENLAQILAKQGKKEKAIDIYKKLIWKYPQKKSYFAALIEDLKK